MLVHPPELVKGSVRPLVAVAATVKLPLYTALAGGLVVGLVGLGIMRWRPTRAIDPIEAQLSCATLAPISD